MNIYKALNIVSLAGLLFFGVAMYTLAFANKPIPFVLGILNILFIVVVAIRFLAIKDN